MYWWLVYAVLAACAAGVAWRDLELRPVGVSLLMSWALSNLATCYLSVAERPAAYTVCETMVLSMAFLAHVCGASRVMVAVVAVSILSITLNVCMTLVDVPTRDQIITWQISTNLCFAAECLLVILTVIYARTRARIGDGRDSAALHGCASTQTEANR